MKRYNIARQAALVRLRDDVDTRFVKYFLSSPTGQEALGAQSLGSVQQVINLRDLKTVHVPTPPLPEQRTIAHILGTLDDKIELNRRMSETLEEMARALFKAWFVDFEPVRAKCRGDRPFRLREDASIHESRTLATLLQRNRALHRMLVDGVSVEYRAADGAIRIICVGADGQPLPRSQRSVQDRHGFTERLSQR